jgi:hypothetical protein
VAQAPPRARRARGSGTSSGSSGRGGGLAGRGWRLLLGLIGRGRRYLLGLIGRERRHLLGLVGQGQQHLLGLLERQRRPLLDEPTAAAFVIILLLPPCFLDGSLNDAMRVLEEEDALGFTS